MKTVLVQDIEKFGVYKLTEVNNHSNERSLRSDRFLQWPLNKFIVQFRIERNYALPFFANFQIIKFLFTLKNPNSNEK
jgi:hypothetical protein